MNYIKKTILTGLLLLTSILFVSVHAAVPENRVQMGEWIQSWLICGPFALEEYSEGTPDFEHIPGFETDFLAEHGGESKSDIQEGQIETFKGESFKWFKHNSKDHIINLDKALSNKDRLVAYAYKEIESLSDKVCFLSLGTNDGGRLWLNGEQIWDYAEGRGLKTDDDLIAVKLNKGKNSILLKVEERGGMWGFCARFMALEDVPMTEQSRIFRIVTNQDGTAVLHFTQPKSMSEHLLTDVHVKVYSNEMPTQIFWEKKWDQKQQMLLQVPVDKYAHYKLVADGVLADGKKWQTTIPFSAGKRMDFTLFEKGLSDYVIVIGTEASESEQWAALELHNWFKEISGATIPVRFDTEKPHKYEIVVGYNKRSAALLGSTTDQPKPDDESFTYKNIGPSIVIWGGKERGSMYGVMTFLEREFGCRWYTPQVSVIPKKEKYSFNLLNFSDSPGIRVRNDFYYEAFNPTWAARNKINGAMNYRQQTGGVEAYWAVHTFYRFMPPDEFFNQHPEYYSLIDGKRTFDHAQLCLTNPDVLDIVTERLKKTMRENPNNLIYSVSQNDWRNPCQCEKCQAIARQEESESGPLIWFVNKVADRIKDEFPDKYVGTLAYQYTRKPCKTLRPKENVVIRLCSIECCFSHDFKSCPENESFLQDLNGWAAISPHLYIWDYVVNFSHYIMPYPNFGVLQSNIKTFRDNKAIGIMEQAAYQSRGGEFAELRAYVISKLLWNPECDVNHVINDFMYGYYGRAGQYVRQYFDLLHDQVTLDTHIHLGLEPDDNIFSDELVDKAEKIFDEAEAVADNDTIRQRIEMVRLPIMYLKCKRSPGKAKYDGTYERFSRIVKREGIKHYAERGLPHVEAFHKTVESSN